MSAPSMCRERIAITGVGLVTPHGVGCDRSWEGLRAGRHAARPLGMEEILPPPLGQLHSEPAWPKGDVPATWKAGWVGAPALLSTSSEVGLGEPVVELALQAAREAAQIARLTGGQEVDAERLGCVIGTSKGGLRSFERLYQSEITAHEAAPFWSMFLPDAPSRRIAATLGAQGPMLCPVAACATGLVSLIRGAALLRENVCDVVVAGSSDASLRLSVLASFRRLGVLAPPSDDPTSDCRPFDRDRKGFVIGEGAGMLVLERWDHAVARGVPILGEWVDGHERGDPTGVTQLDPEATGLTRLIVDLLQRTNLSAEDIDAVSLHGTGTQQNDLSESRGVRRALGSHVDDILAFGCKGGIGHLLGSAGSVELALSVLALKAQTVPPNVNLDHPDPACPLNFQGPLATDFPMTHLLKLSLGFGGHLAAALIRRVPDGPGFP